MKQFVKFMTASCLGTLMAITTIFLFFMFIGLASQPGETVLNNSILHLQFDQPIPELTDNRETGMYSFDNTVVIGMNDIRRLIRSAKTDDKIAGIILNTQDVYQSPAVAIEIKHLIEEFKESGKFVEAYGNYFSQSGYIIASAADSIFMSPVGQVDLRGYGMLVPHFEGFSEKTDVDFDVYYAGKFKSAIEPYYRGEISEENRFQTREFLNDMVDNVCEEIGLGRDTSTGYIANLMQNAVGQDAIEAVDLNLVDGLTYWGDFKDNIKEKYDLKRIRLKSLSKYMVATGKNYSGAQDKVAVVYAEGPVAHSGDNRGEINMDIYEKVFNRIVKDDKIKSVVLRVNSPGGSSITSELFWNKVEQVKSSGKKVVASFGTYAASGGYYIACGADQIVSDPLCLTGSIGVFSMIPDLSEFFENKLGIHWDTVGTGKHTFMYTPYTARNESDHAKIIKSTEATYEKFKKRVAEGRNLDLAQVEEVAQGRVWTGEDAVATGLIDTIGGIDVALEIAADLSNLESYRIVEYPKITKTFYEELMSQIMSETMSLGLFKSVQNRGIPNEILSLMESIEKSSKEPLARLPFQITLY